MRTKTTNRILAAGVAAGLGLAMAATPTAQGPGGPGGGGGRGFGFGGVQPDRPLVAQFDTDGDKRLNAAERKTARESVEAQGGARGGFGGRGFGGTPRAIEPAMKVDRASVEPVPATVPFYDPGTVRTIFIDFENEDWEKELMAFKDSDVEVPATLTIDGRAYRDVGIRFRGNSSFMMVPAGQKHSLNVTVDYVHPEQNILGHQSLNLLNGHEDPSMLRSVLFLQAAREYLAAPKANLVRVAINGEHWGIYSNIEQINKQFVAAHFKTDEGARWKVPGSPGSRAGLEYTGDDIEPYKRLFEIKSKDNRKSWEALVHLTKVLSQTPIDQLESALAPILDIDGALRFLALDNALVNNDGYWVRGSDYYLYMEPGGKFHVLPNDTNETFAPAGGGRGRGGRGGRAFGPPPAGGGDVVIGPGGPGGAPGAPGAGPRGRGPGFMMGGSATLDPLVGLDDATKPLRSRLLAVPALRARYIAYTKDIAEKWLDWAKLGPIVERYHAMIAPHVKAETRGLESYEDFEKSAGELKAFADARRAYLGAYKPQ